MRFFQTTANPSYDQHFSDHKNVSHDLQLLNLVQRLRYIHHSPATPISYTFLLADYWSNTATLELQATLTIWWSPYLATALLH